MAQSNSSQIVSATTTFAVVIHAERDYCLGPNGPKAFIQTEK